MSSTSRRRLLVLGLALGAIIVAAVAIGLSSSEHGRSDARADVSRVTTPAAPAAVPAGATLITVGRAPSARAIAPGFLGLSLEYPAIPAYAGKDPGAVIQCSSS
jgi:hypothetical protein